MFEALQKLRNALLRNNISRPDERVLGRIAIEFFGSLNAVDTDEQCLSLYRHVKDLPSTVTRAEICAQHKLNLDGSAYENNPNLLKANDQFGVHCVVKILKVRDGVQPYEIRNLEIEREAYAINLLQLSNPSNPYAFIHADLLTVYDNSIEFKALKMPKYNSLIDSATYNPIVIAAQGKKIIDAVEFMHSKGIVHMDIKGANIFVDGSGRWLLGDFGSSCPIGAQVTSCSEHFCKENTIGKPSNQKIDWFMLLVTLIVETLDNRNTFHIHLSNSDSNLIDESKLSARIHAIAHLEQLPQVINEILGRLDSYFTLLPPPPALNASIR